MNPWEICAYILAGLILLTLCAAFFKPLKGLLKLALQAVLGGAGLYVFNLLGGLVGLSVGANAVTAAVCGLLGVPGLLLLAIAKIVLR